MVSTSPIYFRKAVKVPVKETKQLIEATHVGKSSKAFYPPHRI